jgi:hypothetical protein
MELARHELPQEGYSKLIQPLSDLGKGIQSLHRSLQVTFCPTRKAEVKDHLTQQKTSAPTDFLPPNPILKVGASPSNSPTEYTDLYPRPIYLTNLTPPAIKKMNMLNSKLTQRSWRLVDWELWGMSASELNSTKLLAVVNFVNK